MEFKDFPQSVKDILLSDEHIKANEKIINDFDLSEKQTDVLFEILRKAVSREIFLENLPQIIREKLNFDEGKAKKISIETAGLHFLVLSDFLKVNVEALIKKWGGNPEDFKEQAKKRYELRKKLEEEAPKKASISRREGAEELTLEEQKAEMIGRVVNLPFGDENLRKRFSNIIVSYLKEVRNAEQVRDLLARPVKIGGLGYDEGKISQIMAAIEEVKAMEGEAAEKTANKRPAPLNSPSDHSMGSSDQAIKKEPVSSSEEKIDLDKIVAELFPEMGKIRTPGVSAEKKEETKKIMEELSKATIIKKEEPKELPSMDLAEEEELISPPPANSQLTTHNSQLLAPTFSLQPAASPAGRTAFPPPTPNSPFPARHSSLELVGPLEEIGELKLIDFRRLDADPRKAAEKIRQKVELLERESVIKKIQGIRAWQNSEVYGLYIELGREALLKNKPLKEIIENRQEEGKPILTTEEFNAILDLNGNLRV